MATFTTPDVNSLPDDFAAIIDYGDGTTDTGAISGGFTVTADHVYAEKGTYTVTIQIFNGLTGASTTTTTTATVADGALTLTGGFESGDPITANLGGFQLATLTDANLDATASDFSVTVNWGDGTIDTNAPMVHVLNIGPGLFAISGSHSYPNPWPQGVGPDTYTVSISVTDADGASASTTSTVVVGNIEPGLPATMGGWVFIDQNYYGSSSDFGQKKVAARKRWQEPFFPTPERVLGSLLPCASRQPDDAVVRRQEQTKFRLMRQKEFQPEQDRHRRAGRIALRELGQ